MKISRIQIKNYRCIKELDLAVDSYSVFIGANGSGKSSVLYALDWFFQGGLLKPTDVHGYTASDGPGLSGGTEAEAGTVVEVTVTFSDLRVRDRERLEKYGRGETATFKRFWSTGAEKDKIVGNALQGPGFAAVRNMKTVGEYRPAYDELCKTFSDLPSLVNPKLDVIIDAFVAWEDDPSHLALLEPIDGEDANHLFGIGGAPVIKQCERMVLIPAATDITDQVGGLTKGSALNELIGVLMTKAGAQAREAWVVKNADVIDELTRSVRASVQESTGLQAERINARLGALVPSAHVRFSTEVPGWVPNPQATVQTDVTIDGTTNDVSRQGHGIQRAVMIAMFQSLVPDAKLAESAHEVVDGESVEEAAVRHQHALDDLPVLLICIEEPEIYQHPIRARAFARVLAEMAEHAEVQVILATHSPYFVRPGQFEALRRFALASGATSVAATSAPSVASTASTDVENVKKVIAKRLPTGFSEGFFADAVVLVEGDTDRVVIESLAEKMESPLDAAGISVLDIGGKEGLRVARAVLKGFDINSYLVVDADALGANRKYANSNHPEKADKEAQAHASHKAQTDKVVEWLPTSTAVVGSIPFSFGDPTVVAKDFALWQDDIETELERWPSFMTALAAGGTEIRSKSVLAYRAAVLEAELTDIPDSLRELVTAVIEFRSSFPVRPTQGQFERA